MDSGNRNLIAKTGQTALSPPSDLVYLPPRTTVEQVELKRVWSILRRRWLVMLIVLVAVLASGAAYTLLKTPVYESTAMVVVVTNAPVPGRSDDLRVLNDLLALTKSSSVQSHLQLIMSPEVLGTAAARLGEDDIETGFGGTTVPRWAVKVHTATRDSDVISISARAYDPVVAANLANSVVRTYIERDLAFSSEATRQGRAYVSSELETVQKQLDEAQEQLAEYKQESKLVVPESQLQAVANSVVTLQNELDKAKVELASVEHQKKSLREQITSEGDEVEQSSTIQLNPQYQAALARLNDLNAKRASLIQEYAPQSKEIAKLDGEIAAAEEQTKRIAETVVAAQVKARNPAVSDYVGAVVSTASTQAKIGALQGVLADRSSQMDELPERERDLTRLMQKVNILSHTYQQLSEKNYALLVNEKSILPNARLASAAYPSPGPASPNRMINALVFMVLAILLAVVAAAVAEHLDDKVRDEAHVRHMIAEDPLSIIPNVKGGNGKLTIGEAGCDSAFAESFRMLRNAISLPSEENPPKLLAVTSPGRGEGKTTTSVNLAIAMAMAGKKVLLVDCDLRRPRLRKRLGISRKIGLTDLVNGNVSPEEAIVPTSIENVFCLPSGSFPPNPAEFLGFPKSREMIMKLSETFDVLILDCPPCAGFSDMQVVSKLVDGILLVVSVNGTMRTGLSSCVQSLSRVNAPILGTVINRLNITGTSYEYYAHPDGLEDDDDDTPKMLNNGD